MTTPFSVDACTGYVHRVSKSDVKVEGRISVPSSESYITFHAAAPPDFRASYTGSALPFPSAAMALEGSPNRGRTPLNRDGSFSFTIKMPNSYYAAMGTVLIPPTVYITYQQQDKKHRTVAVKLDEPIPYRTLTYQNQRTSSSFYDVKLPVRSQEQILRDSAYPTESTLMPENHWGLKPPA